MKCKHKNVFAHEWYADIQQWGGPLWRDFADRASLRCADCGAWLPLGPSDEEPVRVEVRAVEIAADFARGVGIGGHRPDHCTGEHCWHWFEEWDEDAGPCCYCGHDGVVLPGIENECQGGHLARCIHDHKDPT